MEVIRLSQEREKKTDMWLHTKEGGEGLIGWGGKGGGRTWSKRGDGRGKFGKGQKKRKAIARGKEATKLDGGGGRSQKKGFEKCTYT